MDEKKRNIYIGVIAVLAILAAVSLAGFSPF
jgi:hypothetical protein